MALRSLSTQNFHRIFLVALLVGCLLAMGTFFSTFERERTKIENYQKQITELNVSGLQQALWNYDVQIAQKIISGIANLNSVRHVVLFDENGSIFASANFTDISHSECTGVFGFFLSQYCSLDFNLFAPGVSRLENYQIGMMQVAFDMDALSADLIHAVAFDLLTSILIVFFASAIIAILIDRFLVRHLVLLSNQLKKLDPDNPKGSIIAVPKHHQQNELGDLVRHYNTALSHLNDAQNHLRHMATRDALTGLPNRTLFLETVDQRIKSAENHSVFAIMLVDVDRFKDVNDTFGRDGGDILLCTLAARLQDVLPNTATLARLGADEFAIFVPDLPELAAAARLADVLIEKNQAALDIEQTSITPSISVGIALYPEDGSSAEDLLRLADTAMGVAKAKTESAWAYFAPEMTKETSQRLQMETALRAAEKAGTEWEMHLQPKVCFKTGKIRGAEALVRWRRNGELISPFHFIPIAEQTGVIKSIGQWMLHETCRLQARWKDLYGVYPIAVNVSPKQIEDLGFSKSILRYLDQYGLDGNALEVEITESVLVDNNAAIDLFLKDMKSAGIQIAIDDFGTGYSCLSYLQSLHVDVLKIDRSFVMGLPEDNAIARMILDLASHLKMHTVAEGVETEAQRAWLEANNADLMQGYLFSRPVSVQEYEEKFLAPQRVSHLEMA